MEEKRTNTTKLVVIVCIMTVFVFCVGIIVGKLLFEGKTQEKETVPTNTEKTNHNNLVFTTENKDKVNYFIKLALYTDESGNGIANELLKRNAGITEDEKVKLVYISTVLINKLTSPLKTVPTKHKNDSYWTSDIVSEMSINVFNDEYKKLFNEELKTELSKEKLQGCPFLLETDTQLGNLYFSNQCGGAGYNEYYYKNYSYTSDENYFYVKSYIAYRYEDVENNTFRFKKVKSNEIVDVETFDGNEEKFEIITWKFDRNLNFVNIEIN